MNAEFISSNTIKNDAKSRNLLLVEDDAIIAFNEKLELEGEGYKVEHALNGEEAIEIFLSKRDSIDMILMDIDLGDGMDGTQTAIEILKMHDIPIVFLSSRTEKETVQKTENITSYGYIVKNSNITVKDACIKMAFKLFEANRRIEKQREQSETILQSIGDAVIATDTEGKIILMNRIAEILTGWNFLDAKGLPLSNVFKIVNSFTHETLKNPVDSVLASGTIVGLANHTILISKDHKKYQIADSGSPIRDLKGNITGVVLVFRDVSSEYETQRRIEESEKLYHSLFENMLNGLAYCKMIFEENKPIDFIILSTNNSFEKWTGLKNIVGKKATEIFPDIHKDDPQLIEVFERVSRTGTPEMFETYVKSMHQWIFLSVYSPEREYFVAIFDIITERKKIEDKLLQQANMLAEVNDAITAADDKFFLTYWNRAAEKIFGWKAEEVIGQLATNVLKTEYIHTSRAEILENITKTGSFFGEIIQYRKDNTKVFIEASSLVLKDEFDRVKGYITVSRDITDRKNSEMALRASEEKYSILFKKAGIPAALTKIPENTFVDINDAFEKIFEYNLADVYGKTSLELGIIRLEDQIPTIERVQRQGFEHNVERRIRTKSGKLRLVNLNINKVEFGTSEYVITTMQDITESKIAEEKIQNMLKEKEIILKEVHHRIKNNMYSIMSLLTIQSSKQQDSVAKNVLLEAANRVKSMMIMYDKLYRSENTREVSLKEYFTSLIYEIVSAFPSRDNVEIKMNIEDIMLEPKIISPLGMILNELITNAMKYAFSENQKGMLSISSFVKEGYIRIIFEDNGPGIPESISFENSKGFGLQLINLQVKQLSGSAQIERENGTKFIIQIKLSQ